MKTPIVNMFNDADGCYDRIRHNVMAIALRKRGCNKNVIETIMAVLIVMKHHVKCSVLLTYFALEAVDKGAGTAQLAGTLSSR